MNVDQRQPGSTERSIRPRATHKGFTLVDLLVSLGVVVLLIGVLLPALAATREVSYRIVCSSNVRQLGLGVVMYADDNRGRMPRTVYVSPDQPVDDLFAETVTVRLSSESPRASSIIMNSPDLLKPDSMSSDQEIFIKQGWDGLGLLFSLDYLGGPGVFYCPSHRGDVKLETYEAQWKGSPGSIVSSFQYRGVGPNRTGDLYRVLPRQSSIVVDAFLNPTVPNHPDGLNVLRADLAVSWRPESLAKLNDLAVMARNGGDLDEKNSNQLGEFIWHLLDDQSYVPTY